MNTRLPAIVAVFSIPFLFSCSGSPASPTRVPTAGTGNSAPFPWPTEGPATLVGSGDIAICGSHGAEQTAQLLDRIGGTVFTVGDNAYPNGTAADYQNCYGPTWGRHRSRTRPTPGNHEYDSPSAAPYFQYFGASAGMPGAGYYSYRLGAWLVVALNSEIAVNAGSQQAAWLRAELESGDSKCTVAYWHRARFSSGPHGDNPAMRDIWRTLYEFNVDVVISAHDHLYERFAPQDPDGRLDNARGIRQFVVGTGGGAISRPRSIRPNSEVVGGDWGVLALTLEADGYRWEFVPVEGASFRDGGSGSCH